MPCNSARLWNSPFKMFSRQCICVMLLFFALPLLLGAKAKKPKGSVIYRKGFLEVVSPDKMSAEQGKKAAKMVMEAWKFDLSVMDWTNRNKMKGRLTVRLVSADRMNRKHPHTRAYAPCDGKSFVMRAELLDDTSGPTTMALELGHAQANRALGGCKMWHRVPMYFKEGHGLILNRLCADHRRTSSPTDWKPNVKIIMTTTPKEIEGIFTGDKYYKGDESKHNKAYMMGVYLVEYMRTRVNGKGIPDTVPKMGRVFEQVGRGKTYEQAFKEVYGVSVNQVASQIVELFKRTESNPAERFRGTRFEIAAKTVAERSRKGGGAK